MIKNILFATTASPDCEDAATYAFDMAMKYNAKLHIFHVFGMPSHGYSQDVINLKTGEKVIVDQEYHSVVTEEIKNLYVDELDQYGNVELECVIGSPDTEILKKEKKESVDLIILGTHRKIKNKDALRYRNIIGGTMQKVAKGARCPVLIISRPYKKNLWNLKNILFATDLAQESMTAFQFALRFAKENKCHLHIFHAVDSDDQRLKKSSEQESLEAVTKAIESQIEDIYIPELDGYGKFNIVVEKGIPSEEILKYAEEEKVDQIVMAHHAGSIFKEEEVFGGTTEEVVIKSVCPVASVNRMRVLQQSDASLPG